jgi:hypothetical protein
MDFDRVLRKAFATNRTFDRETLKHFSRRFVCIHCSEIIQPFYTQECDGGDGGDCCACWVQLQSEKNEKNSRHTLVSHASSSLDLIHKPNQMAIKENKLLETLQNLIIECGIFMSKRKGQYRERERSCEQLPPKISKHPDKKKSHFCLFLIQFISSFLEERCNILNGKNHVECQKMGTTHLLRIFHYHNTQITCFFTNKCSTRIIFSFYYSFVFYDLNQLLEMQTALRKFFVRNSGGAKQIVWTKNVVPVSEKEKKVPTVDTNSSRNLSIQHWPNSFGKDVIQLFYHIHSNTSHTHMHTKDSLIHYIHKYMHTHISYKQRERYF